ncbi:MAG: hypothetical protein ILP17_05570 [Lachnospiraceae bacterium]|nr:hypothetical protein [Lachnospiraceae bacterium]
MGSGLVDESKKQQSKLEQTRSIIYGDRYSNVGFVRKGWYNTVSLYRLTKAETGNALSSAGRYISNLASTTRNNVAEWYKYSKFENAVNTAGTKVAAAGKAVKDAAQTGAKKCANILSAAAGKVKEAGKSFKESAFAQKVSSAARKTGGWFKSAGAWIKDKAIRLSETKAAHKVSESLKAAGNRIKQGAKGAAEIAATGLDKAISPVVSGAKKLHNSAFGRKVREAAKIVGSKTAGTVKSLAHHAASGYDNLKSRYTDWKFEHDRAVGFNENQIGEMLRKNKDGRDYEYRMNRFRQDVLAQKDVRSHIRLRADKERIKRNAGDMEKGKTGDFELVEMNEDGQFKRDDPGSGMLQSLNKYDLANVMIPDTEERKRTKISLDQLQHKAKKEPEAKKNGLMEGMKNAQSQIKNLTGEAETYMGAAGVSVPASGFAKAFGNVLNIADGKEKEKNMASLVTGLMDQAGKIMKMYGQSGSFGNLAGALNIGVNGLSMPKEDADKLTKAKTYLGDIQSGMKILGAALKEAGVKNTLADKSFMLGPVMTIIDGVDGFNKLAKTNEKLKSLTDEDKSLNLTDTNVIRHIDQGSKDMVRQNKSKQVQGIMNTGLNTALSTIGLATGTGAVMAAVSTALCRVSPVDVAVQVMKKKTDHELMMEDVFGSMDAYRQHKDKYGLTGADIEREILKETGIGTAKEYASRVRAETALHLHARTKQAEQFGIENGATKLRDAGGIGGKTAKDIYKELGGREDFDKIVGRSKKDLHKQKVEDYRKKRTEALKKQSEDKVSKIPKGKGK